MMTIYTYIPTFAPKPLAWGKFKESPPDTYFFLMEFLDLSPELPDPIDFCTAASYEPFPNREIRIFLDNLSWPNWRQTEWHENWCYYFTRLLAPILLAVDGSLGRRSTIRAGLPRPSGTCDSASLRVVS